jgi:asparagine synthase (glutamine-hydrolysing)
MCGINGIYNHKSLKDVENKVKLMNSLTKHRGPDYSNIYLDSSVCIGHNRLSIIDLDSKSNQPFISADENLVLSYNGEIYNFLELKEELSKSYDFKTKSDTEVIIAAYSIWGIEMVYKFNGMFSFALWDKSKEELFLCRDRFGIKPLYYIEVNQSIIFSSSIKALKSFSHEELKIKEDDLLDFLQYGTVHQPNTILDKVKSVPRGSFLMAGNQETKIFEYWNLFESNNLNKITSEPLKTVNKLLLESVEKRLISDVPYGIFLSGGIDSSILVAAASKVSTQKVNTFSIVFKEKGFDERKFSRQIASKYKTNHLELELNPEEILQQIEEPFKFMDHPSVDGINTFFISKQVHNQGFKMALSGAGSDELFAGYPVFKEVFELENKKWLYSFPPQLRNIFGKLLQLRNKSLKSHKIAEILNLKLLELPYFYPIFRKIFANNTIYKLCDIKNISTENYPFNWAFNNLDTNNIGANYSLISKISALEIETYLQNVLLRDADQMGMANSLEIRVPFLDHNLVEYVLSLPNELKYPIYPKKLLIDSTKGWIPDEIIHRKKMGFVLPWEKWMRNELSSFCEESLLNLEDFSIFNMSQVNLLWKDFVKGNPYINWLQIWSLVVLGKWTAINLSSKNN